MRGIWIFGSLSVGIVTGSFLGFELLFLALGVFFLILSFFLRRFFIPLLCLSLFFFGAFRYPGTPSPFENVFGREVLLKGTVISDPDVRENFVLLDVDIDGYGKALVGALLFPEEYGGRDFPFYKYGDRIELKGKPKRVGKNERGKGYGAFIWAKDIKLLGEGGGALKPVYILRDKLLSSFGRLPEPLSSLSKSVVLGRYGYLAKKEREIFKRAGLFHIFAPSGLHVAIIGGILLPLSVFIMGRGRPFYILPPLFGIWFYALLVGLKPSIIRASIMGTIWLFGEVLGRPRSSLNALLFAGAVMLLLNPLILWTISFHMSFMAMLGVILFSPLLANLIKVPVLRNYLAPSIGASLFVLPIISLHFGELPIISPLSSALLLPILPFFIPLSILSLLPRPLSLPFEGTAWLLSVLMEKGAYVFSLAPCPKVYPRASFFVLYYSLLLLPLLFMGRRIFIPHTLPGRTGRELILLPVLLSLSVWAAIPLLPDGLLHIHFFRDSPSVLIKTPSGKAILISRDKRASVQERLFSERMPFWKREVELVIDMGGCSEGLKFREIIGFKDGREIAFGRGRIRMEKPYLLRLYYGKLSFIFPFGESYGKRGANVLMVGDFFSKEDLRRIKPDYVVLIGRGRGWVLKELYEMGVRFWRTEEGDIEFVTDGERLWLRR